MMEMPQIEELQMPNMAKTNNPFNGYAVRYLKADLDDMGSKAELEIIHTKGIDGSGDVVIMSESSFSCMDKFFVILKYLEKIDA